ncbi:hypothetical protein GGQ04_003044 [Salinibacter ruber]|jgi:hypothetical protein|nr:hypothetical protein [Salinibacter ruber]MCS4047888.1 hypothetical protein [Salinibacter ruber]
MLDLTDVHITDEEIWDCEVAHRSVGKRFFQL